MIDGRTKNAEIFRDTERRYTSDPTLMKAVQQSTQNQIFIAEGESITIPSAYKTEKAKVIVSGKRSLEAAEVYAKQSKKVCVLNFASATNPGGGVVNGSSAQEECICRCTTLYPCLNINTLWNVFYKPHRKTANPLYNNDCIYTPDVCVFKNDTNFPEPLPQEGWWNVNVLTCAAPNLRERPSNAMNPCAGNQAAKITPSELEKLLTARIKRIFDIAAANGNEVLILGAFGCGAFRNPPEIVAKVFNTVMQDYLCYFDTIEYAVYHTEREIENYEAFKRIPSVIMTKTYNKLVRDRIPEIIEVSGKSCKTEILSEDEYLKMLDAKLDEELAEYHKDQNIEELADLLEVIHAATIARGYTLEELEAVRAVKAEKRGGFSRKILLKTVTERE